MVLTRILVSKAALLVIIGSSAAEDDTTRTVAFHNAGQCLSDMNGARKDAGLTAFIESTDLFQLDDNPDPNGGWKPVCDSLLEGTPLAPTVGVEKQNGSYSFFVLARGATTPDCSAAVKSWKSGFSIFDKSPPLKDTLDASYMTDGVHFLTLYNPSKDAKAECKTVVCTEKPKANSRHGAEEEMKRGSGLLCLTTPNPFKTIPLYTQDQWDKVAKAVSSSTTIAVPSFLAFALVLTGGFLS